MLILVFAFNVGKYCNEKKKGFLQSKKWLLHLMNRPTGSQNASSSSSNNNKNKEKEQNDETIEKIRLFVLEKVTEYIEKYEGDLIMEFTKANLEIANIFFFFYWATEWALKYHGPTGPDGGGSGSREKNPFSKWIGSKPRVLSHGSGQDMKKTRPLAIPITHPRMNARFCQPSFFFNSKSAIYLFI